MLRFKNNIVAALEALRVRNQIRLITWLSAIGLIVSIVVLSLLGITLQGYLHLQESLLNDERLLADIRFQHSEVRADMEGFIRQPSPSKARNFQKKLVSLKEKVTDFTQLPHSIDLDIPFQKMQTQLGLYKSSFDSLWQKFQDMGLGYDQGLLRELNLEALNLKQELKNRQHQALELALLDIRQNEKDYFLTNLPLFLVGMKQLYDDFLLTLERSELSQTEQNNIRDRIYQYYQIFVRASYLNADVQQAKLTLEASHKVFAENLLDWMEAIRQQLEDTKASLQERIELFLMLMVLTAVFAGIAVFLAGRFVTFTISRPISQIVKSLQRLSEGDRSCDIPYKKLDNEVGQIARAAEVFKESLYQAEKGAVNEARRKTLEESNQQLEIKVKERTEELAVRNDDLNDALEKLQMAQHELLEREKLAALGALVAGVSHELNTPLGNALTVLTSLGDERKRVVKLFQSKHLKESDLITHLEYCESGLALAEKNLYRASELVKNFKQVAVDQTSESRRLFSLKEVTDEVVATLTPSFKHHSFEFQLHIPDDIMLDSYPGPYGQVISNLINNACLHGFDGRPYGSIQISAVDRDDEVMILVSDDGIGMSEDIQQRIFEPFYTTKLGQGGSGLGMNIVYNMVTGVLGGKIHIFSHQNKGTQVELKLPKKAPESDALDQAMIIS
ncbi:sensor histidine kinase [Litoribrevibacter albus]|uniref:histidine kinase n=1 Tax=Litoribrevibacter albus TaxID=1473156 RepID=A0AA37S6K3_9GAMM|nr:ATP-binding protein [Litoribrevibacter albus]GLQ29872.1 hypothetical protein GCM10007876_03500 [Litoribrevibacter albus]